MVGQGSTEAERTARTPTRRAWGAWAVVAALLAIGIVVPLLVPVYARDRPTLGGFPFFYWFQFAMIPVVSALTYAAFRLSLRATARDRDALGLTDRDGAAGSRPGLRTGRDEGTR